MLSWAEIVLAVVIHASALAYAHLGVTLTPQIPEPAASSERRVARSDNGAVLVKACSGMRLGSSCTAAPVGPQHD
ncbi:MAG: hypothetical protein MH112_06365 [Phenylobacterium sp.]|uniref:hypothetical protein n=1 Tax=Phenylobacterium sp. TaxID=1871053 RepID=UPI0025FDC34D|nr:hypothetical protein [Phenylobacterium sp.]MCG9915970.1 hypothetical protein [Phenylobacterium sp.]